MVSYPPYYIKTVFVRCPNNLSQPYKITANYCQVTIRYLKNHRFTHPLRFRLIFTTQNEHSKHFPYGWNMRN